MALNGLYCADVPLSNYSLRTDIVLLDADSFVINCELSVAFHLQLKVIVLVTGTVESSRASSRRPGLRHLPRRRRMTARVKQRPGRRYRRRQ